MRCYLRLLSQSSCSLSPGTQLRFHSGSNVEWQDVEDLDSAEEDSGDEEQSTSLKVHNARSVWQRSEFTVVFVSLVQLL